MKGFFIILGGALFAIGGIIGAIQGIPVTEYMLFMIAGMIGIGFGSLIREIKNE